MLDFIIIWDIWSKNVKLTVNGYNLVSDNWYKLNMFSADTVYVFVAVFSNFFLASYFNCDSSPVIKKTHFLNTENMLHGVFLVSCVAIKAIWFE